MAPKYVAAIEQTDKITRRYAQAYYPGHHVLQTSINDLVEEIVTKYFAQPERKRTDIIEEAGR